MKVSYDAAVIGAGIVGSKFIDSATDCCGLGMVTALPPMLNSLYPNSI